MIIYIEKQLIEYTKTKNIMEKFKNSSIVFIDNYKNISEKKLNNFNNKSFIVAKLKTDSILDAPEGYGHNNINSYFLKTSLNCVFDCSYCFLKGAFKNDIPVYFVNYEDIKNEVIEKIKNIKKVFDKIEKNDYELKLKSNYSDKIWFYSSDYSDVLAMNYISGFIEEFVPFFEDLDGVMMEIRTKSSNIKSILDLGFVPKNTEFAFSLNPQVLIDKYEFGTSSLDERIKVINILIEKGYNVGIRFLPLLPVENYKQIYTEFVKEIRQKIDMKKIKSTFVSGLLYTKSDYSSILKKYPKLDILYRLKEQDKLFIREPKEMREFFYSLFSSLDDKCYICLDEK